MNEFRLTSHTNLDYLDCDVKTRTNLNSEKQEESSESSVETMSETGTSSAKRIRTNSQNMMSQRWKLNTVFLFKMGFSDQINVYTHTNIFAREKSWAIIHIQHYNLYYQEMIPILCIFHLMLESFLAKAGAKIMGSGGITTIRLPI